MKRYLFTITIFESLDFRRRPPRPPPPPPPPAAFFLTCPAFLFMFFIGRSVRISSLQKEFKNSIEKLLSWCWVRYGQVSKLSWYAATLANLKLTSSTVPMWDIPSHREEFFRQFAKKHKFDPLIAENWYKVQMRPILMTRVRLEHFVSEC